MTTDANRRRITSPRRATLGAVLLGVAALGLAVGPSLASGATDAPQHATAKTAVGSDIGALDVTAKSAAITVPLYSHQGEDVQLDIPYSLATLGTGGIGNALTTVLWPGATGAHGGDTLNLLNLPIPSNLAQMLNDPEVAHAQTGVGDKTVDLSHPGLTMTSTATPLHVSAESAVGGSGVPVVGPIVGSTQSKSSIKLSGASTVTSKAISSIHNLSIAGVIKIDSITSTASAVSDGRSVAKGKAKTVVAGVSIAGIKVTLDQNGLHIPNSTLPIVGSTATKVVNTALKSAGISLDVTKVTHKIHGQHIQVDAGALIVSFGNSQYKGQANDTGKLLILGGASIDQTVRHGFKSPPPPPVPTPTPTKSSTSGGGGGGGGGVPPVQNPPPGPQSSIGPAPTAAPPLIPSAHDLSLPKALQAGWVVAALIGAGLFAIGMRRLPDRVLQNAGATCSLEE
jgi:hypothetical protein